MHKIALVHLELAIVSFDLNHVGLDKHALHLGGHVINRNVPRTSALRRGNKISRSLVRDTDQVRPGARLAQRIVAARVRRRASHFAHAGLHVHQHN